MREKCSIHQPTPGQLLFKLEQDSILLKLEEEEIWRQDQLVATFEDITGIAVRRLENTSPLLYNLELSLVEDNILFLGKNLEEEEAQQFVHTLFEFLGIEYNQ